MKYSKSILAVWGSLWLCAVGTGLFIMLKYENTPGLTGAPPPRWPVTSQIHRMPGHTTLVMLAHPHCPCTRASIGELAVLMAHAPEPLDAYVLFLTPPGITDSWEKTDLWYSAAAIPGVHVLPDKEGVETRRFQATTSGQTVLYDAEGRLVFNGGITGSRGHFGDNAGRSAILSFLHQRAAARTQTFVFGCSLFDPAVGQTTILR